MREVFIAFALMLNFSAVGQDKPNTSLNTEIESTGNQIPPSNSESYPVIVSPSNPVRNETPVGENTDTYQNSTYRDYDYRSNVDNVYYGRYPEPPTRNEMRYRQGQQCFTEFELNLRPFTVLNGYYGAGLELSTSCRASFLFDFSSGRSTLFDLQATSGMVGFRFYSKTGMVGRYASVRARGRSYENGSYYGGNLALTGGYKADWDGVTLAGEIGLGYQGADGVYITLPTWAITLGYRL